MPRTVKVGPVRFGGRNPLALIAGPCVIESREGCVELARKLARLAREEGIPLVFKASYDKANRSSHRSYRGPGLTAGLEVLAEVKSRCGLPILTDVHAIEEVEPVARVADVLQIPAFLCRQTSLLMAAARTGKQVNIKKGQFMSPESMRFAVDKVRESGNDQVALIERGVTFGYQDLVIDYRGIPVMQSFDVPVILDCTHSLQQPNQATGVTGGRPRLIETVARAGIAVGADGLFIETHPRPGEAKSDGANMLPLDQLEPILERLLRIRAAIR